MIWDITAADRSGPTGRWLSAPLRRAGAIDASPPRPCTEHAFRSWDGSELFYRQWPTRRPSGNAVILIHRGHEHSGRLQDLVDQMNLPACTIFAWDARGHGRSPGVRGDAPSFGALVRDLDCFAHHLAAAHGNPTERTALVASSLGAVIAGAWVHGYAPPLRALVLAAPAFRVRLYVPFAIPLLRLRARLAGRSFLRSYVRGRWLTHDDNAARAYDDDPLVSPDISVDVLLGLHDAATRLVADAGAIRVPTLVLTAGSDRVVRPTPQRQFVERLSSPVKEQIVYPGLRHGIFQERHRALPIEETRAFLQRAFAAGHSASSLRDADKSGYTKAEFDRLSAPLPLFSAKRLQFAAIRAVMRSIGRLSKGVRVGWRHGFDSGPSLDYVYENRARGWSPAGRLLDRLYLDTIGWAAIRRRKVHLEELLETTIARHFRDRPLHIADIAAGPGRYLLDTIRKLGTQTISAELRDRDPHGLAAGRALARAMDVESVRYVEGDAFDPQSIVAIAPRPDVVVVSGLYELFNDNEMILRSLRALADVMKEGGFLLYTNQPWHPQIELIARVLTNREGKPWLMRRRTQAEIDELVASAGFDKQEMRVDEHGIFTVSLARKRDAR
ncbi:MAG TPA: bifunctional alpha/beta hydrolase/class I SAM-dependent methyltransferase [Candidatus Angelobacter sp.]|nr:bifunctional alpha/beta hydrolase/class I SAM-dependent methyltransferase [Candidatus Angelobacter sp.]